MTEKAAKTMGQYFNEEAEHHDDLFIQKKGMGEFYDEIERQIKKCPAKEDILVLGCGTGLEIERVRFAARVTAVDIADKMLDILREKELDPGVELTTLCGSMLDLDYGEETYDLVIACYVMHHFEEDQKALIYRKIYRCLTPAGTFLCADTMAQDMEEERKCLEEARRIYRRHSLPFASLHVDAPLCIQHEREILHGAGFGTVTVEREWIQTKLYRAVKDGP